MNSRAISQNVTPASLPTPAPADAAVSPATLLNDAAAQDVIESAPVSFAPPAPVPGGLERPSLRGASAQVGADACCAAPTPQLTPDQIEALGDFRAKTIGEVAAVASEPLTPAQQERHRLYSLLLMSVMFREWNGNKYGADGVYPWREGQAEANGTYSAGHDYKGHNIAAIAVDRNGAVIDFDFNHNALFRSSMEHAEARLVKRVFGLSQVQDTRRSLRGEAQEHGRQRYGDMLKDVTVYTSLESCTQCTGIMMLGRVKEVVYMQPDTGMYNIGNILFNLSKGGGLAAPSPLPASAFGLDYFEALAEGFRQFKNEMSEEKPFVVFPGGKRKTTTSITSYLCTDIARDIFKAAHDEFNALSSENLNYGDFKPDQDGEAASEGLSNQEVLAEVQDFFKYAVKNGDRGTPHH